jgi:hypothetical protein
MKPAITCSLLTATFLIQPTHTQNGAKAASLVEAHVGVRFSASQSFTGNQPSASLLTTRPQQSQPTPDPKSPPPPSNNKPKRKVLDADLSGFDISDPKSDKKVTTMLGGSRTAAIPSATLLAPKRAKFYGQSAIFDWSFTGHSEGYILIITDEDETQLVHLQLKETRYRLDTAATKFRPGQTYYWRVQVLPNPLASEPLEFEVVSVEEQQAITKAIAAIPTTDPYQSALAKAQILTDRRLWFDALGAYDDLIAKYPDRSELYNQRGAIYAQIPATKLQSESDFARADKSPQ